MNTDYIPEPIDTSCVEISSNLLELTELLAKNTHDVWAANRLADGWSFGPETNDELRKHPCLVPYEELPEYEKEYDRNTAMETLKMIIKLGFKIEH